MKYRKKQSEIEATQWNRHGDHPAVLNDNHAIDFWCVCGRYMWDHGRIETTYGDIIVHPSDWIIEDGEYCYPMQDAEFKDTYEPV